MAANSRVAISSAVCENEEEEEREGEQEEREGWEYPLRGGEKYVDRLSLLGR